MRKFMACLSLCIFLAATAYGAKLSLKFNSGGTYLMGGELLYELSPSLAAGVEVGYLSASVESSFSRDWHNYKLTLTPTLSAIPIMLNIHYDLPLCGKMKLHAAAGGGAFISRLNYGYAIEDTANPYNGTRKPNNKSVFGAKAGIGIE